MGSKSWSPLCWRVLLAILLGFNVRLCVGVDSEYEKLTLERIAFGSCNKPWLHNENLELSIWKPIVEFKPQAWIWSGDAFYTSKKNHNPRTIEAVYEAKESVLRSEGYNKLLSEIETPVVGTWDDHDYGVNDGGKYVHGREQRKQLFLDFLGVANNSKRRNRDGVYSSQVYGSKHKVKIICLDTRFNRDSPIIPNVNLFSTLVNCATRMFAAVTGLIALQNGTILGDEQWKWLEAELHDSVDRRIAVNIIVSSVQVLTRNPLVESWGHFPKEKRRLVALLEKYKVNGLVLLSGDVHIGQIISLSEDLDPIEVTSSGLTHDCSDGNIPRIFCEAVYWLTSANNEYYIGRNYGTIDILWNDPTPRFVIKVRDVNGAAVLNVTRLIGKINQSGREIDLKSLPLMFTSTLGSGVVCFLLIFAVTTSARIIMRSYNGSINRKRDLEKSKKLN